MNRNFVRHISFIGSGILLVLFWVFTIGEFLSEDVFIGTNASWRGSGVYVSGYSNLVVALPMTILWCFGLYKYYFCPEAKKQIDESNK